MPQSSLSLIVQVSVCPFYCPLIYILLIGLWMHHWLIICAITKSLHLITNFNQLDTKWWRNATPSFKNKVFYKLTRCWQAWARLGATEASVLCKERYCFLMIQHKRQIQALRERMLYVHEILPSTKGLIWHWWVPQVTLPPPQQKAQTQSRCSYAHHVKPHTLV